MKINFILTFLLFFFAHLLSAQSNLQGSWQLVSSFKIDKNGEKQTFYPNKASEILIFTPTHIAFINEKDNTDGKRVFSESMIGTYKLAGSKLKVKPIMASWKINPKEKREFIYKVIDDKFTEYGTITTSDGATYKAEYVYHRINLPLQETGEVVGTWKETIEQSNMVVMQIITPIHMFHISHKDGIFYNSILGITTKKEDKIEVERIYVSSDNINKKERVGIQRKVVDGKLQVKGTIYKEDGTVKDTWSTVMERVNTNDVRVKTAFNK